MESTNVEFLFENNSIAEIKDIQEKLKKDVERKKDDLKQLVGQRYRDLIDASDIIHSMRDTCGVIISDLADLTKHCEEANKKRFCVDKSCDSQETQLSEEQILTFKCNLIVRIPSEVYMMLDEGQIHECVYYYFLVQNLYQSLDLKHVPTFIVDYLYAIDSLHPVLTNYCWKYLRNGADTPMEESEAAKFLACIFFLDDMTVNKLLTVFLDTLVKRFSKIANDESNLCQLLQVTFRTAYYALRTSFLVFFDNSGAKSLLFRTIYKMQKTRFDCKEIIGQTSPLPNIISNFTLKGSHNFCDLELETIKKEIERFLSMIDNISSSRLLRAVEDSGSVSMVFGSVNEFQHLLIRGDQLNEWDEACETLLSNRLDIWSTFFKEPIVNGVKGVLHRQLRIWSESLFDRLKHQDLNLKLNLSKNLWETSDVLKRVDVSPKASGVIPLLSDLCSVFDRQLMDIWKDAESLLSRQTEIKFVPEEDLGRLRCELLTMCLGRIDELGRKLDEMIDATESGNHLSFLAHFGATLTESCPSLKRCLEISVPGREEKWNACKQNLMTVSFKAYERYFKVFVKELSSQLRNKMSPSTISKFLENSLMWDETTYEELDSNGEKVQSVIRTPMYISVSLHHFLTELVTEINAVAAHTIRKNVLTDLLVIVTHSVVEIYTDLHSEMQSNLSGSLLQTFSLQLYFDSLYLKSLFEAKRDETVKNDVIKPLAELSKTLESSIDPFDLHVFTPRIQENLAKLTRCSSLLFGIVVPESRLGNTISSKSKDTQHNLMAHNCLSTPFPLLVLNSKS